MFLTHPWALLVGDPALLNGPRSVTLQDGRCSAHDRLLHSASLVIRWLDRASRCVPVLFCGYTRGTVPDHPDRGSRGKAREAGRGFPSCTCQVRSPEDLMTVWRTLNEIREKARFLKMETAVKSPVCGLSLIAGSILRSQSVCFCLCCLRIARKISRRLKSTVKSPTESVLSKACESHLLVISTKRS